MLATSSDSARSRTIAGAIVPPAPRTATETVASEGRGTGDTVTAYPEDNV